MQDEVENKTITLAINASKMTGRVLKNAMLKYLRYIMQKDKEISHEIGQAMNVQPHGKQSVKKLIGQGQTINNIEITDKNIKSFERVARKYGVDYALKKDITGEKPKYLVFFKARDADALTAAFKEYSGKSIKREKKPSVLAQLQKAKKQIKESPIKEKGKELER